MGYSPKMMVTQDMTASENHWHLVISVYDIEGNFVETVSRTVMSNDGKQYITYKGVQYNVKKLKRGTEGQWHRRLKLSWREK